MTELGRQAKALIERASGCEEPTAENRARVRAAITAKLLGAAASGATLAAARSSAAATGAAPAAMLGVKTSMLVSLALAGVVGVGTATYVRSSTRAIKNMPARATRMTAPEPAVPAPSRRAAAIAVPTEAPAPSGEAAATEKPRPVSTPPAVSAFTRDSTSSVEAEMVLIGDARDALRAGETTRALVLLDEHARRYPIGALGEERDAMRITSLCVLGRVAEARAAASQFLRARPDSPHAGRVRASCGSGSDSTF